MKRRGFTIFGKGKKGKAVMGAQSEGEKKLVG